MNATGGFPGTHTRLPGQSSPSNISRLRRLAMRDILLINLGAVDTRAVQLGGQRLERVHGFQQSVATRFDACAVLGLGHDVKVIVEDAVEYEAGCHPRVHGSYGGGTTSSADGRAWPRRATQAAGATGSTGLCARGDRRRAGVFKGRGTIALALADVGGGKARNETGCANVGVTQLQP